ncbi:MAG: helix-turn-helix transcriptional regulator [Oscillospiraceae bacterium]|nr:helix-turn-helix transcriptional regulator [Oscillospiraceae bacterium]
MTVAELTGFLGISQPYLFKLFKARFGLSPKQYLAEQKLHRAKTLLRQSDMTVTHIANSVGFSDVLAFSRFFTNKEGISPQKYRNSRSETHGR